MAVWIPGGVWIPYLAASRKKEDSIERIELVRGPDESAPIVVALTVETGARD